MSSFLLISLASLPTIFGASISISVKENAINPTSSGQIGVNPVTMDLGPESEVVGPIGTDTEYLSLDGSSTKWIGVNTEYLTDLTITTTVSDKPVTITSTVQLGVATATASGDGLSTGDISVLLPEAFRAKLEGSVSSAIESCNKEGLRKRQDVDVALGVLGCLIGHAFDESDKGGVLDWINNGEWTKLRLTLSDKAPTILKNAYQMAKTQANKNKLLLFLAATTIVTGSVKLSGKIKFDQGQFGQSAKEEPTPSVSACNPSATLDEYSPGCNDVDCVGDNNDKCTLGGKKGCSCLQMGPDINPQYGDMDFLRDQQKVLAQILAGPLPTAPPECQSNTDGDDFNGHPKANPESWCICTSDFKTGLYSTIPSTTSPCAYATMPSKTINISVRTPSITEAPTSCRTIILSSSTAAYSSCTCNDDRMYPIASGSCPDINTTTPTPTPTPSATSLPLNKPNCNQDGDTTFHKDGDGSASNSVSSYCRYLIAQGLQYPGSFKGGSLVDNGSKTSDKNKRISMIVTPNQRACSPGSDYKIDLKGSGGQEECMANFMTILNSCPSADGGTSWKGGVNYNDCAIWQLGTQSL